MRREWYDAFFERMGNKVDSSDAFPTPFERRIRQMAEPVVPTNEPAQEVAAVEAMVAEAGEPRHIRPPAAPPPMPHQFTEGPRYMITWTCAPCGIVYGTEHDNESIRPPGCPVCGRTVEKQAVIDRASQPVRNAPPPI